MLVGDGAVVGYFAAIVELDVFNNVAVAREIAEYLRPAVRTSLAGGKLTEAFEAWAKDRKAARLQCLIPTDVSAAADRGYVRAAVVMSKEVSRG